MRRSFWEASTNSSQGRDYRRETIESFRQKKPFLLKYLPESRVTAIFEDVL
ncbi:MULTISPECIES: hypothetical protein [Paenibacillus]|uniref:hypothetical protein n=1 Tax=Paenibacillus TaxID=44249 RepID=UPI000B03A96D|nr:MULTISPECIES: hypothetical protein [Paenibacillus]GCL70177.1 hypothetical protein PN4B1_00770 [Paenibacillus naphthalenovorans]